MDLPMRNITPTSHTAYSVEEVLVKYEGETPDGYRSVELTTTVPPGFWMFFPKYATEDTYSKICDCNAECEIKPALVAKKGEIYINIVRVA